MSRAIIIAVIAALALPVLALAALVGQQEQLRANARILSVPLTGFSGAGSAGGAGRVGAAVAPA